MLEHLHALTLLLPVADLEKKRQKGEGLSGSPLYLQQPVTKPDLALHRAWPGSGEAEGKHTEKDTQRKCSDPA